MPSFATCLVLFDGNKPAVVPSDNILIKLSVVGFKNCGFSLPSNLLLISKEFLSSWLDCEVLAELGNLVLKLGRI